MLLDMLLYVLDELFAVIQTALSSDDECFWQFTSRYIVDTNNSGISDGRMREQVGF